MVMHSVTPSQKPQAEGSQFRQPRGERCPAVRIARMIKPAAPRVGGIRGHDG